MIRQRCDAERDDRAAGDGAGEGADQHRGDGVRGAEHRAEQPGRDGQRRVRPRADQLDLLALQPEYAGDAGRQAAEEADRAQAAVAEDRVHDAEHGHRRPQQG